MNQCPFCRCELDYTVDYLATHHPETEIFKNLKHYTCAKCGFGAALPELTSEIMTEFYKNLYRSAQSTHSSGGRQSIKNTGSLAPRQTAQWLLLLMFKHFKRGDSFCNLGAGGDSSFYVARSMGLDFVEMHACEIDDDIQKLLQSRDVKIIADSFGPHMPLPNKKFSAILMSHLLEHYCASEAPLLLKKVHDMLADDGLFLCEVPNDPMRSFGQQRLNDSPHLTFWTKESLALAMQQAGLEPLFIATADMSREACHQKEKLCSAGKTHPLKKLIKDFLPRSFKNWLGTCLTNWAQKKLLRQVKQNPFKLLSYPHYKYGHEQGSVLRVVCKKGINQ